jgi:hypothetical protein
MMVWSLLQQQQRRGLGFAFHLPIHLSSCLSRFQSSTNDIMSGQSLFKEELRAKRLERLGIMSSSEDLPAAANRGEGRYRQGKHQAKSRCRKSTPIFSNNFVVERRRIGRRIIS